MRGKKRGYAAPKTLYPAKFRTDPAGTLNEHRIRQQCHFACCLTPKLATVPISVLADSCRASACTLDTQNRPAWHKIAHPQLCRAPFSYCISNIRHAAINSDQNPQPVDEQEAADAVEQDDGAALPRRSDSRAERHAGERLSTTLSRLSPRERWS